MKLAPSYTYAALVERVVDGDTVDVELDLGLRLSYRARLRLRGVNAPEVSTDAGRAVRDLVRGLLPVGTPVVVRTSKPDKYGRTLADVQLPDGRELGALLLFHGHATAYDGGTR